MYYSKCSDNPPLAEDDTLQEEIESIERLLRECAKRSQDEVKKVIKHHISRALDIHYPGWRKDRKGVKSLLSWEDIDAGDTTQTQVRLGLTLIYAHESPEYKLSEDGTKVVFDIPYAIFDLDGDPLPAHPDDVPPLPGD